jgi:hypothetical protein
MPVVVLNEQRGRFNSNRPRREAMDGQTYQR